MYKTLSAPLTGLTSSLPRDIVCPTVRETTILKCGMLELLVGLQAKPAGTARQKVRDADWIKDITQLVARITPHKIDFRLPSGLFATQTVGVKIDTVRCEIDDEGEICAWIYEES